MSETETPRPATIDGAMTQSLDEARRGRLYRRLGVFVMAVFVTAGLFGWFGHRQGVASAETQSYRMEVSYPKITRAGLAAGSEIRVERIDGKPLPASIQVRSDNGYFKIFDENGLSPEPAAAWSDESGLNWTFEPEPGTTSLVISFDARLQPNVRGWFDGSTSLIVDGEVEATISYRTWAVP